jgi:hypothetical protein
MPDRGFSSDAARVRFVLLRELETITEYEDLARTAESPEMRTFFLHLAEEEKEHVAEAIFLLRQLDPGQHAQLGKSFSDEHFAGAGAGPPSPAKQSDNHESALADLSIPPDPRLVVRALPAPPSASAGSLTVGPLKRRER